MASVRPVETTEIGAGARPGSGLDHGPRLLEHHRLRSVLMRRRDCLMSPGAAFTAFHEAIELGYVAWYLLIAGLVLGIFAVINLPTLIIEAIEWLGGHMS